MIRASLACVCAFGAFAAGSAFATDIALPTSTAAPGYGQWNLFDVSDIDSQSYGVEWIDSRNSLSPSFGSPLFFSFSIGAGQIGRLTIVDAGFAGDTFQVTNLGSLLGSTSAVALASYDPAATPITDFNAALADPRFSRGVFQLGAGSYLIGGSLGQSLMQGGAPLNATLGAVQLTVSAVPEPATWASLLAGAGVLGAMVRRRRPIDSARGGRA